MSFAKLFHAVGALRDTLLGSDVLRIDDEVTITLPYEAGVRFAVWSRLNMPTECWYKTWMTEGGDPMGSVTLDTIKIQWPLKLLALPNGKTMPEPILAWHGPVSGERRPK